VIAAVLFDLLSGLLDSWSLWDEIAGEIEVGRRWRRRYLEITSSAGDYRPYPDVVAEAAVAEGLQPQVATELSGRWSDLEPWPEVLSVLLRIKVPIGVVTNCSDDLGRSAAHSLGIGRIVTAERAGAFKPDPRPYQLALKELGLAPEETLFVAGSPFDVSGAADLGMPVFWHNRPGLDDSAAESIAGWTRSDLINLPSLLS